MPSLASCRRRLSKRSVGGRARGRSRRRLQSRRQQSKRARVSHGSVQARSSTLRYLNTKRRGGMDLYTQIITMLKSFISNCSKIEKVMIHNFDEFLSEHRRHMNTLIAAKKEDKETVCVSMMQDIYGLWEKFYNEGRLQELKDDYKHSVNYKAPERKKECIMLWEHLNSSLRCILKIQHKMSTIGTFYASKLKDYDIGDYVEGVGHTYNLTGYIIGISHASEGDELTVGSDLPPETLINMHRQLMEGPNS